jgi:hypothetical protein
MAEHVVEAVEGDIAAEHQERGALRLEGVHRAGGTDHVGEGDRVGTDIGADVDDRVAQLHEWPQRLDLEVAPFAVEVEPAADERVVAVVHEQAVPAAFDGDVPVLDQVGRQHVRTPNTWLLAGRKRRGRRPARTLVVPSRCRHSDTLARSLVVAFASPHAGFSGYSSVAPPCRFWQCPRHIRPDPCSRLGAAAAGAFGPARIINRGFIT